MIADDELQLVKNYITGKILASIDGPFKAANTNKGLILAGLEAGEFNSFFESVKSLTAEDLNQMAVKYLDFESMYRIAYG